MVASRHNKRRYAGDLDDALRHIERARRTLGQEYTKRGVFDHLNLEAIGKAQDELVDAALAITKALKWDR